MPLVDLTTNLSNIKKLFGSKTKTAGKTGSFPHQSLRDTPNTGPNATSVERQSLEDRFNAGVPGPNRKFGSLVNQATPTVPTTMEGTPAKITPFIQSNWTVFKTIADRSPRYPKLEENKKEYQYFKQYQSALNPNARGTYGSVWKQGKVILPADPTPPYDVSTIKNDQYTTHSKTYLFPKGLLGDFTSFPDIPSKKSVYPTVTLSIPRGGVVLTVKRGLKDIERHAKWLLSPEGVIWGLTQAGLQVLNARAETRIWNPLSLGSIIPTIHIPRHTQKFNIFGINTQAFGKNILQKTDGTYSAAGDYIGTSMLQFDSKDLKKFSPVAVLAGGESTFYGGASRLITMLGGYILDPSNQYGTNESIGILRRTPGQRLYLVPGKGGIYGKTPSPHFSSQLHLTSKTPINIGKEDPQHLADIYPTGSLGTYKTLVYGELKRIDRGNKEAMKKFGSPSQFGSNEGYDSIPSGSVRKTIVNRYKLGDPGLPGRDRSTPLDGVNWKKGERLDTVDLLNVQGYIPPQGAKNGATLADGTPLHFNNFSPESGDYPDLIPLHFYDTVNKAWILFRAYIGKFNDSVKPSWGNTQYAGRPTPQYYYQNTERSISFDFQVAAQSAVELAPLWQKLNYLVGLCYPSFTGGAFPTMRNPFIKLTLGDVYHHVPGFLTQLTMTPIDKIPWEIIRDPERGLARVPMGMNISTDFTYVGDSMPSSKSPYHFLNNERWIDHENAYWSTEAGTAYPARLKKKV